jgi:hypothetical protein
VSANTSGDDWKPPYISFRTLLNLIERMADNGTPPRIDRTFLSGSEGAKTQVIAALKALGFLDVDGNVTPLLVEAVKNPDGRKALIRQLLEQHFPEPVRLGTINATQGQLQDAFKEYGISGDTMRKAIAFYLRAAEFAGVPVSPNFKTPSVQRADGSPGRKPVAKGKVKPPAPPPSTPGMGGVTIPKIHPALAGILGDLPPFPRGWTQAQKDSFKTAFNTMLDYSIPVVNEEELPDDEEVDEEEVVELNV